MESYSPSERSAARHPLLLATAPGVGKQRRIRATVREPSTLGTLAENMPAMNDHQKQLAMSVYCAVLLYIAGMEVLKGWRHSNYTCCGNAGTAGLEGGTVYFREFRS